MIGGVIEDQDPAVGLVILAALSDNPRKHVYGGTVPEKEIARRRRRNRVARRQRKLNRRAGK